MRRFVHGLDRLVEKKIGRRYNLINVQTANELSDYNLLEVGSHFNGIVRLPR